MATLRQQILPQLEQVGLIMQERSTNDSREMTVIPLETEINTEEIYSVGGSGVNADILPELDKDGIDIVTENIPF